MKRLLALFIVIISITGLFADGVQPTGSGTEVDPYQIATLDNLLWISTNYDSWDKYYIQTSDIDASETQNWNNGLGFTSIGIDYDNSFTGQYNGQGYNINNLFSSDTNGYDIGLFGYANGAVIRNVGLYNADISGYSSIGCLVGCSLGSEINNCYSSGIVSGETYIGGLVGCLSEDSTISYSYSSAAVNGNVSDIGGLVGKNGSSIIMYCYSSGNVNGQYHIGGLVGRSTDGISRIRYCFSIGNVTGIEEGVGGLIGYNGRTMVYNCYSLGNASGSCDVGGFVGSCSSQSSISMCYSKGSVSSNLSGGGFVGYNDNSSIYNSFWDIETSGMNYSYGGTGKTTVEMKDVATYTNLSTIGLNCPWDFVGNPFDDISNEDYWDIDGATNNGYPYLVDLFVSIDQDEVAVISDVPILKDNFPNPFNPSTTIRFSLLEESKVVLSVYNIKGQKIKTLSSESLLRGNHSIIWNGDDAAGNFVSSGAYLYKLNVNGKDLAVKKCLLLK